MYQIEDSALELLRTYGTPEWEQSLKTYQASVQTLKQRYANERQMVRIPIVIEGEVKALHREKLADFDRSCDFSWPY